ncbi:hypothetical protein PGB90_004382 [Kerria lacca]
MQPSPRYVVQISELNDEEPRATIVHMQHTPVERYKYKSQILATLAVSLGPFAAGLGKGYSSPAIASLQDQLPASSTSSSFPQTYRTSSSSNLSSVHATVNVNMFTVNNQQASWVASLSLLGALFGAIFGGLAMKYGRKNVLLATAVPFSISWILTLFAINVEMMYATSFIAGFCCAIILTVSQVYISEISDPNIRGCLSAILKVFNQVGVLISFIMGAYLNWRQLAMAISLAPVALFFTILYVPETPSYLVLTGRFDEAAESLQWLRGGTCYEIHKELVTIKNNVIRMRRRNSQYGNFSDIVNKLWHPILITCCLMFFQRFSGVNAFNFYAVSIFRQILDGINPHGGAIAMSFVQLLASLVSGLLIDSVGRLPLLITSSSFMSIALAAFGSYAYFEEVNHTVDTIHTHAQSISNQYDWIPLLCVLTFTIAFSLGISPISWLLVGELFTLEYRGLGSALAMSFSYGCAFIGVKTFVDFRDALGLYGAFWMYSAMAVAGLCFIVCFVPETKGRDLYEMDDNFLKS